MTAHITVALCNQLWGAAPGSSQPVAILPYSEIAGERTLLKLDERRALFLVMSYRGAHQGKQALAEMGIVTVVRPKSALKLAEPVTVLPQPAVGLLYWNVGELAGP